MTRNAHRRSSVSVLRRLGSSLLEAPDVDTLAQLATRTLAEALGVREVVLLLWDRRLERFEGQSSAHARRQSLGPAAEAAAPSTRWLLVDGLVQETPGKGDGVLVPLLARSGLVGMLVLSSRPGARRRAPFRAGEARLVSDLAARLALALENNLYQQELIASERMAALGTMAGMLAHDFRGPMTVIRGHAELIQRMGADAEVQARADAIVAMVDRLERMTRETLDFARGASRMAWRTLSLRVVLAELAGTLAEEVPGLVLHPRCESDDGREVTLDLDKLRRVVGNLGANAGEAMGGRGALHLVMRCLPAPDGAGERLELVVSDEGPGVPDEVRERVFEPFVTHGKKGGTGLGLAVARRFVEDHGGSLELLDLAPGAHFRIALPLGRGPGVTPGAPGAPAGPAAIIGPE